MKRFRFKRIHSAKNKTLIAISILLILFMGVGYAAITSNLSIAGNTEIVSNTWNIHFENLNVTPGSVETTTPATINQTNPTQINYGLTLKRSGDFYEFVVDIKNDGSIPGKISVSEITGITTEMSNILDYSINYMDGNPVSVDDILNAGAAKRIRVRVSYKDGLTLEQLPTVDLNFLVTFNLTYVQSEVDEQILGSFMRQLINENTSCMIKYEGDVTDEVGVTVPANNVYFNNCADKRNIIIDNMCWQMVRTTDNGGIKMVYNGDVVNNKCESTRGNHKGIVQTSNTEQTLDSNYLYGDYFTYDITNNTFTLMDIFNETWSDSTYENLLGKFTCKSNSDTCTTLYQINSYKSNTEGYSSTYTIGNTNYATIGTSSFNSFPDSPAMVGYMFNKTYNRQLKSITSGEYKYGSSFTYDASLGTYTLSGTTQNISDWSNNYTTNTHYTCWNTTGTCNKISYVFLVDDTYLNYINLSDGKSIDDALNEMLSSDDVNQYNSSIKGIIDTWYRQNLSEINNALDETVYCNARNIVNKNGWDSTQNIGSIDNFLFHKNYYSTITDLSCKNITDQFSIYNNKAMLQYKAALISIEEWNNIASPSLKSIGTDYWSFSPVSYRYNANLRYIQSDGNSNVNGSLLPYGIRPAIVIERYSDDVSGDGSETSPWQITKTTNV